ncbi:MAG: carboxymuconolactone decarboxylase family protein [SAR202 cluster bacterium]|nr:carboxymuconolactone decarboxylase family protein [SAR202 cluster bacterium]
MARVPYLDHNDLAEDDRHIYDRIAETRGSVEPDTPMPNSFRALHNSPGAADAVGQLGEYLRFHTSLDPVCREIAIISVAREASSPYEWAHHAPVARRSGVPEAVINAIRTRREPPGLTPEQSICAKAAKELVGDATMSAETFATAERLLGTQGVVDLVTLVGYYAMLSAALAALQVDVEDGQTSGDAGLA